MSNKRSLIGYYPTLRWKEFRQQETNSIDLIFLGSSHCYQSLVPSVFDTILNINSFNMGSSFQTPVVSYYTLLEILETQHPQRVIMEVHHETLKGQKSLDNASHCFDFFNNKRYKYNLIKNTIRSSDLGGILFPTYRYNNFKRLLFTDTKQDSTNNAHIHTYYSHKGYAETPKYKAAPLVINGDYIISQNYNELQIRSLEKIIDICKEKEIELTLITQTHNPDYFSTFRSYESFYQFMIDFSATNGIKYIDFNQPPFLNHLSAEDFYDTGHLFKHGAEKFSMMVVQEIVKHNL